MSEEYDTAEYFVTNAEKQFPGNALELMVALYKASNCRFGLDFTPQAKL